MIEIKMTGASLRPNHPSHNITVSVPSGIDADIFFKQIKKWCVDNAPEAYMVAVHYPDWGSPNGTWPIPKFLPHAQVWSIANEDQRMLFVLRWCS